MNNRALINSSLSARQHQQYLAALGICWWIPSNQPIVLSKDPSPKVASGQGLKTDLLNLPPTVVDRPIEPSVKAEPSKIVHRQEPLGSIEQPNNDAITDLSQVTFSAELPLKMLDWQSVADERGKKLLIICRHKTDQPANSFALKTEPSGFMQEYITALNRFSAMEGKAKEARNQTQAGHPILVRLAHLAEAGIGNRNQPLSEVLKSLQPDLVLVLGEESIFHLSGKQVPLARLRGRLIELQGFKALVSYHPFSLIKNPALKSLAYQDLSFIFNYLNRPLP